MSVFLHIAAGIGGTSRPWRRCHRGRRGARGPKVVCATAVAVLAMTVGAGARSPDAARRPDRPQAHPDDAGRPGTRASAVAPRPEPLQAPRDVPGRPGTRSPDAAPRPERAGGAPSPDSLARIRAALAADRDRGRSRRTILGPPEDGWIAPPRPSVDLAPGLGFIEGLGLYDDLTRGREPVPMGGPTHWAMMNQMTPREVNEAVSSDALGIGTASAFALVPHALRKLAAWFSGSGPAPPADPVLTASQRASVIEDMRAGAEVIDAGMSQRGRTVALSLVMPAGTEAGAAREMGERFVRLVSRRSGAEPARREDAVGGAGRGDRPAAGVAMVLASREDPAASGAGQGAEPGPGVFDYVVSVRSPTDDVIARGGKATTERRVRW